MLVITKIDGYVRSVDLTPICLSYTYDTIGNMTYNSQVGTYTYPANGIRPHAVTNAGSLAYTYDNNGNMRTGAGRTITPDPENRPGTIIANGLTTTFDYDGNGERVKKTTNGTATIYIGKLYECVGTTCYKYIFANGQRIARKTVGTAETRYYHTDHLGSSSVVTDETGGKVEGIAYYPYGASRTDTGSVNMHHKFTGQELDAETGLYFYNARYYDPQLGRFISADTTIPNPADPQAFNRYSYVRNNPINLTDPSGHSWLSDRLGGGDNVTAIAAQAFGGTTGFVYGAYMLSQSESGRNILAGEIVAATAVATWYCGGCGAAPMLQGGLVGEMIGGYGAHQAGGDALRGVFIGGVSGALTGTMFHAAGTMTAGTNPLIQIGAKGISGGIMSSLMGGRFETGFMYAAAAATLYWGYTEMVGFEPTMAPGENNLTDGQYDTRLNGGRPPQGSNVTGLNNGQGGFWSQGGTGSNIANHIPGINATGGLHDYWMNNMTFNMVTNVGTMIPAAVMSYGAQLGGQLAPITVQQSVNDSR